MKKIYQSAAAALLAIILAGCTHNYYRMGNEKFESMAYSKAIVYYEKSLAREEMPNALINLAESYRLTNNTVRAEECYRKVVNLPLSQLQYPVHKLYLAEALKANAKYEEAAAWLNKYLEAVPDDERAMNLLKFCDSISVFMEESYKYTIREIPVNSKESNFSPVFYKNGIVFCSERTTGNLRNKHEWTGNAFLDLYYSEELDSGKFSQPQKLEGTINSSYHEGPSAFTGNGTEMYFTRTNMNKNRLIKSKDDVAHLKIMKARLVENKWIEAGEFPYNNNEYSVGHPSVSADGNIMFFVSDVPGGLGGSDIYMSRLENGKWSLPENLGKKVNTPGNEAFPFYYNNGKTECLFFSSNGRPGLGGLDVYCSLIENSMMQQAVHISSPINSSKDDFGFIIDKEYKHGYFSSNRDSIIDKIYSFNVNEPEFRLELQVKNALSGKSLANTKLILYNLTDHKTTSVVTDETGMLKIDLNRESDYKLISARERYRQDSTTVSTLNKKQSETFTKELALMPVIKVRGTVVSKTSHMLLADAAVDLLNLSNRDETVLHTGPQGDFEIEVSADMGYHFLCRKENFFAASMSLSTKEKYESETIDVLLELEEIVLNKAIRLDNIYYDYNKADIRADAEVELDKLVKILEENPEIKIELSSHTDSRGNDAYNMRLSQKRAENATKYIISKGINSDRIIARGYGESRALNKCLNNIDCSEEEHQLNRRTEFKVLKLISGL
jgi:outer membrane protein OmpA-like peptidoglycan-associated protein